jgi:hypothetical protein
MQPSELAAKEDRMKRALFSLCLSVAAASPFAANAYCTEFRSIEALPAKYHRIAPLYGSDQTGWIFASNQFEDRFELDATALSLLGDIAGIFARHETPLAIMMPPSRPVIAGEPALEATSGGEIDFDIGRASASFSRMVDMVNRTGVIMPDLQAIVLNDARLRDAFYFKRDTHWTPVGAAASAIILSRAVAQRHPALFPDAGSVRPTFGDVAEILEEPGSLSKVAEEVCGSAPDPEFVKVPFYPSSGGSLFGDAPARQRIALLGTSFSNAHQRDAYRVGEATAGAFQADVENYSVSGGGMIAPVEVFVLAGGLGGTDADLVIWEVPFNDAFGSHDGFRQVKGALLLPEATPVGAKQALDASGRVALPQAPIGDLLVVTTPHGTPDGITVELTFADGTETSTTLRRRGHFPADWRLEQAATSLSDLMSKDIVQILVVYDPDETGPSATVQFLSSGPADTDLVSQGG